MTLSRLDSKVTFQKPDATMTPGSFACLNANVSRMPSLSLCSENVPNIHYIFDGFNALYAIILLFFKPEVESAFSLFKEGKASDLAHVWDLSLDAMYETCR